MPKQNTNSSGVARPEVTRAHGMQYVTGSSVTNISDTILGLPPWRIEAIYHSLLTLNLGGTTGPTYQAKVALTPPFPTSFSVPLGSNGILLPSLTIYAPIGNIVVGVPSFQFTFPGSNFSPSAAANSSGILVPGVTYLNATLTTTIHVYASAGVPATSAQFLLTVQFLAQANS